MILSGIRKTIAGHGDEGLVVRKEQEIPDEFLRGLDEERDARKRDPGNEWALLCSVPVVIADQWCREGFNIYSDDIDPQEIVRRLRNEDLTKLIVYS